MFDKARVEKFFELLAEIVNTNGPVIEKRDELVALADEADKLNLGELSSWFAD